MARQRGGATRLGEEGDALGVRGGDREHDEPAHDQRDRRQSQPVDRDDAQREKDP